MGNMYENYLYHLAEEAKLGEELDTKKRTENEEREDFYEKIDRYRKHVELKDSELDRKIHEAYTDYLQTALEAVYITAIGGDNLAEHDLAIASSTVKKYIEENGGALALMNKKKGKTYLLDAIFEAVQNGADADIRAFLEADDDEEEEKEDVETKEEETEEEETSAEEAPKEETTEAEAEETPEDSEEATDPEKEDDENREKSSDELIDELEDEVSKEEEPADEEESETPEPEEEEPEEAEETPTEEEDENREKSSDELIDELEDEVSKEEPEEAEETTEEKTEDTESTETASDITDEEPSTEEPEPEVNEEPAESSDDVETAEEPEAASEEEPEEAPTKEDPVLDEPDTSETIAELPKNKEDMFKELESTPEINDAVDIITKRISDAEAEFIQKNAADKEKIEAIVDKVNDRIQAVNGDTSKSEEEVAAEVAQLQLESVRDISNISDGRAHTVFEELVQHNMSHILSDKDLREQYTVDGKIDMKAVVESTKVVYGFLEFINTIQLENVNQDYIKKTVEHLRSSK